MLARLSLPNVRAAFAKIGAETSTRSSSTWQGLPYAYLQMGSGRCTPGGTFRFPAMTGWRSMDR
jgi:hypothetical protein